MHIITWVASRQPANQQLKKYFFKEQKKFSAAEEWFDYRSKPNPGRHQIILKNPAYETAQNITIISIQVNLWLIIGCQNLNISPKTVYKKIKYQRSQYKINQ